MATFTENWGVPVRLPLNGLKPIETETKNHHVISTSVLAIKFKDGIMMAADTLGTIYLTIASYGSLARFRDMNRFTVVGQHTLIGTSGDISDMQYLHLSLRELEVLTRIMYHRRSKMDPLWNKHVIGGVDPHSGEKTLGYVDLQGTRYESDSVATGYGAYLAQPLLREAVENRNLSLEEARDVLENAMKVLYYRDARSTNQIIMAIATADGVRMSKPFTVESDWSIAEFVRGYH